jgi:hypothetical protein
MKKLVFLVILVCSTMSVYSFSVKSDEITTAVARNSGMNEDASKKVGASASVLAGTAAAILLSEADRMKQNKNHITVIHRRV